MKTVPERYRNAADTFTARVRQVPSSAWENPAPCEGWVARDVVRHLVEWVPGFFTNLAGLDLQVADAATVDDDPLAAWSALDGALRAALDEPAVASRTFEMLGTTMDEMLRQSGHYGPRVDVPADADEQTQLIAFTGRQP